MGAIRRLLFYGADRIPRRSGAVILGALAVVALGVTVLLRHRRPRSEGTSSRLFRAMANDASADAGDWTLAMLREHDAVEDRSDRSRFARGAILAVIRTKPSSRALATRLDVAADAVLLVAATGLAAASLIRYPALRADSSWIIYAVIFTFGLVCYAVAALVLSNFGTTRDHLIGALVAFPVLVMAWVAGSDPGAPSTLLASTVILVPALAGIIDVSITRERTTAWVAGTTCAITAGLAFFCGFVGAALATNGGPVLPSLASEAMRSVIHPYAAWAVGDTLGGACFMLVYVLVLGGLIGLGTGVSLRRSAAAAPT